jgi:hypothetical protein
MSLLSNWRAEAVCADDPYAERWVSYKYDDVQYAKNGCARCEVRKECLVSALSNDGIVGVVAGISEFEYLMHTWHEATRENESNWRTDDSTLSGLLQKVQ